MPKNMLNSALHHRMRLTSVAPALLLAGMLLAGCKASEEKSAQPLTPLTQEQTAARFYYDLGSATVDVSAYPSEIQENYKTFLAACGACHTTARPLNAPYKNAYDWKRYVQRMHLKIENRGLTLDAKRAKKIVEFLVYDSKIRKIDGKEPFEAQQTKLKTLFDEILKEREALTAEQTKKLPKKETPYVGVK